MPPKKKTAKKTEEGDAVKKKIKTPQLLRGFRDIMPEEDVYWARVEEVVSRIARDYSFDRIRLPIVEQAALFDRTLGKGVDILEKEMYRFVDESNTKIALRPEATASVARAYIEHGMVERPQPVKIWYIGQMFRHDRPQAGRYRQFWQFGLEAVGSSEPIIDAQIIIMCHQILKELGIEAVFQINSIGSPDVRREYEMELVAYFKQFRKQLSDTDKKRLTKNPLRLLDSKEEGMEELKVDAPQIVDWLDDDSKEHFMKVIEYLDEMEVPYELNPFLVRGLDYYNKTVFEIIPTKYEGKSPNALGGGGRYDGLIELLGGREGTPAMGMAMGVERLVLAMKHQDVDLPNRRDVKVFFCQLGDAARRTGLRIFNEFREAGIPIAEAFGKGSLKAQLELADKQNVRVALILGQKEVLDGTIIIRDMESGAQEIVDSKKVVKMVEKTLK